jgi:hypothetical protein
MAWVNFGKLTDAYSAAEEGDISGSVNIVNDNENRRFSAPDNAELRDKAIAFIGQDVDYESKGSSDDYTNEETVPWFSDIRAAQ